MLYGLHKRVWCMAFIVLYYNDRLANFRKTQLAMKSNDPETNQGMLGYQFLDQIY